MERDFDLLWTNEVHMRIHTASGYDHVLSRDNFGVHTDNHTFGDPIHHEWISRFSDTADEPVLDPDIRFNDSPSIDNDGIRNDQIQGAFRAGREGCCPMPSRITLPPPNTHSSP